jgi:glycerol-3-phosphate cytidylyltransferase-like family protein
VNLLRNARALCDKLIVGVTIDELVAYKNKRAVIPFMERIEVVKACRYADVTVSQESMDKFAIWEKIKFDVMFVGDDWYQSERWNELEEKFKAVGVRIMYLPYTKGTSSTLVNETLHRLRAYSPKSQMESV